MNYTRSISAVEISSFRFRVSPGPAWTDLLVRSQVIELLFSVMSIPAVRSHPSTSQAARICLLQLAALKGGVFPKDTEVGSSSSEDCCQARTDYVCRFVTGLLRLIDNPLPPSAPHFDNEMIDLCGMCERVVLNFRIKTLLSMPTHLTSAFLEMLTKLICSMIDNSNSALQGLSRQRFPLFEP